MLKYEQDFLYNGGEDAIHLKKRSEFSSAQYNCYSHDEENPYMQNKLLYVLFLMSYAVFVEAAFLLSCHILQLNFT